MNIDLSNIETERQLHQVLSTKLGFPSFYGNNWDAFWDAITGLIEMPEEVVFLGANNLKMRIPNSYDQLKKCLEQLNKMYPSLGCSVTWS